MDLSYSEIEQLEFADEKVKTVVLHSIAQGAKITKKGNEYFYYDPFYSSAEINIDDLRYKSELGLYHD